MVIEDATLIAGISTVTGIVVKGLDVLYTYIKKQTVGEKPDKKLEELLNITKDIYELLSKSDPDGIPLTYVPRRLITQQNEQNEISRNLTHHSEMVSKTLEKVAVTLENMVRILDKLEDRSSHKER